jgi:hypothetical protein
MTITPLWIRVPEPVLHNSPFAEEPMAELEIKLVRSEDLAPAIETFAAKVYPDNPEKAQVHFADHAEGEGATFLAYVHGELAG